MRIILTAILVLLFSRESKSQCMAGFSSVINGQTVSFTSQSGTSQGTIIGYSWNFGDPSGGPNNTSFIQNPVHVYSFPGTYLVQHTIFTSTGCQESFFMMIIIAPSFYDTFLCPPVDAASLSSNSSGTVYHWQISTDGGNTYSNLLNGVNYTGVLTNQLQLHDIPSSFAGYRFRCVTDGNAGVPYKISFTNYWTGTQNNLWSNPANWSCGALPDAFTDVYITTGAVLVNVDATVYSLTVAPPAIVTVQTGINFSVLH